MKKVFYAILFSLFFSSPCFANAQQSIEQAEKNLEKVAKLEFEWSTTAPLIQKAKKALADGNEKIAEALAKEAIAQTEYGFIQAEYASKNWQEGEPK
ncbi:MAG: hypothetical protein Q9M92_07180 [Enterobacterales bacterium]|nr:hypothetical protein [Enterobacterales bacterium]